MPGPEERQEILKRAGVVLQRARELSLTLDEIEVKLSWQLEHHGDNPNQWVILPPPASPGPQLRVAA